MMSARPDMSDFLIHFTSGATVEDGFSRFCDIVAECRLTAGCGMIRGTYPCVCLSEAPLPLPNGLVNPSFYSRYQPFGILFSKTWVFAQGGRPVIYQPDSEYDLLPPKLRWRHVRYEPPSVDFTWEREWRVHCSELPFDPGVATLVLPSEEYVDRMIANHSATQAAYWYQYADLVGLPELREYREDFPWMIATLGG
jgi:hypothetical protein